MNTFIGLFFRYEQNGSPQTVENMLCRLTTSANVPFTIWHDGKCALGFRQNVDPLGEKWSFMGSGQSFAYIGVGRLDNRTDICSDLGLSAIESECCADSILMRYAYEKWGERCTDRLYGDWSFAVWHPQGRRLFLARDHFGLTSLYYYADRNIIAFASSRLALQALNIAPLEIDELYLAQVLTSWPDHHGERTIHKNYFRLPPAHRLTATVDNLDINQYWYLEKTPLLYLPKRVDYVEAFSELFDDAVKARLKVTGESGGVASTLSGGLDSSSVTATAARFMACTGQRISAYTSVPLSDTTCYVGGRFGDEYPLAEATARFAGNVDITTIDAGECTPIQAIRKMLQISNEPEHAACNFFWMLELWKRVRDDGNKVLLLGQFGNAGISWKGDLFSQSMLFQLRRLGWKKWTKERLKRNLPAAILSVLRHKRPDPLLYYRESAIKPAFAERLNLFERRFSGTYNQPIRSALEQRSFLQPGRCAVGALLATIGQAFGVETRDPTADARVLAFTFSVPDQIFIDPKSGVDRWLIREAMKGRLPETVRLSRSRGRQSGDLVPRLRACAAEVECALSELASGPAAEYVDVPYMRQAWQMILREDSPESFQKSITILTRGIMAGLFVNDISQQRSDTYVSRS